MSCPRPRWTTWLADYDWSGRSIERHRAQVRAALGFRESTRADEDVLAEWLADKICPMVFTDEVVSPEAARLLREHSYDACPLDGGILSWRGGDKLWRTARKAQTFPADRTSNAPWKY